MKINHPAFAKLAEGRRRILVFDCEFWHCLARGGESVRWADKRAGVFFLPREMGGFVYTANPDGSWTYHRPFYATFAEPDELEFVMPISKFASVSSSTAHKLDALERQLSLPWGEAFPSRLPEGEQVKWREGVTLYGRDPMIHAYRQPPAWIQTIVSLFADSMVIVKGTGDLDAIQNMCAHYGLPYTRPTVINDIAGWNEQSTAKCGTAKLDATYACIQGELDDRIGNGLRIRDILPAGQAHDPSADAAMTFLVALYIVANEP